MALAVRGMPEKLPNPCTLDNTQLCPLYLVFGQDAFEGLVILGLMKQPHSPVPGIENVIDQPRFDGSCSSRHAGKVTESMHSGQYSVMSPLSRLRPRRVRRLGNPRPYETAAFARSRD